MHSNAYATLAILSLALSCSAVGVTGQTQVEHDRGTRRVNAGDDDCMFYKPTEKEIHLPKPSIINPRSRSSHLPYKEGYVNINHLSFFILSCRDDRFVSISDQMIDRIMVRCIRGQTISFLGKEYDFRDVTCMEITNTLSCAPGSNNTYLDAGKPPVMKTGMHSKVVTKDYGDFRVVILPSLSDNYQYLVVEKESRIGAAIDPTSTDILWDSVRREKVKLTHILNTHHHRDHAGRNKEIIELNTAYKLQVVGGDCRIVGLTQLVEDEDCVIKFGSIRIKCIRTPGHTVGHLIFYVNSQDRGVVFTGDSLFVAGCGRFFEGNATDAYNFIEKLTDLPDATDMYCGHEYSVANLRFSMRVDPDNEELKELFKKFKENRDNLIPNVPTNLGLEKRINPFMQIQEEKVIKFTGSNGDPVDTIRRLRDMKDAPQCQS